MWFKKTVIAFAVGGALVLAGASATSQTTQITAVVSTANTAPLASSGKLATQYSKFAGSQTNADALVSGLRDQQPITLVAIPSTTGPTAPSATFTPVTGKLGYGNINIALSLAKADLAKQGITNPTPAQLAAALNGGTIATATGSVTMAGVLSQRQAGMGWGQIANSMGVKLGSLVSASKTDKAGAKTGHASKAGTSGKSGDAHAMDEHGASGGHSGGGHGGGGGGGKK